MAQRKIFDDFGEENEDDLVQNLRTFEQAVVWGTDWTTETITNQLLKQNIDLKPKFQRRDAWTRKAKSKFIESLFLGLPIPQIILAEKKDQKGKYLIIDGKQRLLTIRSFFAELEQDDFRPLKLTGLDVLPELNNKTYSDLKSDPAFHQHINQIQNQPIRTTVIKNWPDESFLFTVFLRLNTGSAKLSPQELRQALHPGNFIDFADEFSINSVIIKQMLGLDSPDFRMRDVELVIRFYCFKYFITNYDGNLKASFDNTVKTLNRDWQRHSESITLDSTRLENAINVVLEIFGEKSAFSKWTGQSYQNNFNRAIFDIMVYYFSEIEIGEFARQHSQEIKQAFQNLCVNNRDFLSAIETTTKSIENTYTRFNLWGEALASIMGIKINVPIIVNGRLSLNPSNNGEIH